MKLSNLFMIMLVACVAFFSSCEEDAPAPAPVATVTYKPSTISAGDVDGDVVGTGGSTSKSYTWQNASDKAEYNMDITATKGGSFQLIIKDANGQLVLDKTLDAGSLEDSKSGSTSTGAPGAWSVTVILTNFNGDGSFSLSQGI